jgi:hypothetical protein
LRRLPPKAQQNIGATLGSPQICKRSPRGLGFTAMRSKMHSPIAVFCEGHFSPG